jgi:hypothetical protein
MSKSKGKAKADAIIKHFIYKNNEENYFHGFIRRHSLRLLQ